MVTIRSAKIGYWLCLVCSLSLSQQIPTEHHENQENTDHCDNPDDPHCHQLSGHIIELPRYPSEETARYNLSLRNPIAHVQENRKAVIMRIRDEAKPELVRITLSTRPVIYEFPHFLSIHEANELIEMAKIQGMDKSYTEKPMVHPSFHDRDHDGFIDIHEMRFNLENIFDIYFQPTDVREMYTALGLDDDNDGLVPVEDLQNRFMNEAGSKLLHEYIYGIRETKPHLKGRHSESTWFMPNQHTFPLLQTLTRRAANVLQMPMSIMNKSDLQVVHYDEGGFYNLHLDSGPINTRLACCSRFMNRHPCRSCRWATLLIYLNNVTSGGETAFPLAEHGEPPSIEKIRDVFPLDLHYSCPEARLLVKPTVGKAILWYNHLNHTTQDDGTWIGPANHQTLHGSCPILEGEKWIANFWIKVTDDRDFDLTPTDLRTHH